jgi:hypothetical protein
MRYSPRTGRWHGKVQRPAGPDPYSPNTPGHAERHRHHVTDMGSGLFRIDHGDAPKRLPCETQPVPLGSAKAPARPEPAPVADQPPETIELPRTGPSRSPRGPWGLNRGER